MISIYFSELYSDLLGWIAGYEVYFEETEADEENEALRMEHFYFPLGLWFVVLILSAIFLLADIIYHSRKKSQTQSTVKPENMGCVREHRGHQGLGLEA